MTARKLRYAQVGIGSRSQMYTDAIVGRFAGKAELAALCDTNQGRMNLRNRRISGKSEPVPTYIAGDFDRMIGETRPDAVIVTSVDATHSRYICRAMELGCDVVAEKPMTTDAEQCRRILRTRAKTGRNLRVTFNYRYSPPREQVREILASGAIGEILSVDFAWLLDTQHGADYFRRWHRRRENSGSLLVHKATHHFDLVNWWLSDVPEEVFCHGSLRYYRPQTAGEMGLNGRGERCTGCSVAQKCPFHLDLAGNSGLKDLYVDNEDEDGYFRDRCVFASEIDIWDNMTASIRYARGTLLSYILHCYSPYEGYRIAFNGTKGRLEHATCESSYISGDGTVPGMMNKGETLTILMPHFAEPQPIEIRTSEGGHGGGDEPLLADIFDPGTGADPLGRRATQREGALSIMVGIAAARSIDTGEPVAIAGLLQDAPLE